MIRLLLIEYKYISTEHYQSTVQWSILYCENAPINFCTKLSIVLFSSKNASAYLYELYQ